MLTSLQHVERRYATASQLPMNSPPAYMVPADRLGDERPAKATQPKELGII